ncbi:MAG: polymer-forming cytoskeletal protein [Myxococcota bacterium]|nr:polymer-forming cytoskeletal protein [Myxococcota bacterium]
MAVLRRDDEKNNSTLNIHDVHTILGPESTFEGKLIFEGTVRIDGTFKGEIETPNILVVGQGAKVEATLKVGSIIVNGEVEGDIIATETVELNAPAIIRGNITTPDLTMAKGVIFEGSCHMEQLTPQKEATVTVLAASQDS